MRHLPQHTSKLYQSARLSLKNVAHQQNGRVVLIANPNMPTEMHVGDIKQHDLDLLKPVSKWDMSKPKLIDDLRNQHETVMTSLCTVFSDTTKQAGR